MKTIDEEYIGSVDINFNLRFTLAKFNEEGTNQTRYAIRVYNKDGNFIPSTYYRDVLSLKSGTKDYFKRFLHGIVDRYYDDLQEKYNEILPNFIEKHRKRKSKIEK